MQKHASLLQEMDCALTILVFQNETQVAGTIFGISIAMRAKSIQEHFVCVFLCQQKQVR